MLQEAGSRCLTPSLRYECMLQEAEPQQESIVGALRSTTAPASDSKKMLLEHSRPMRGSSLRSLHLEGLP